MPDPSIGFVGLLGAVSMLSYSVFARIFATRLLRRARKSGSIPEVRSQGKKGLGTPTLPGETAAARAAQGQDGH